ncbi:MAG: cytochrome C [Pseudomonadota bacterium]|nr:cytochrome C [Pseudomonadota bacterium]
MTMIPNESMRTRLCHGAVLLAVLCLTAISPASADGFTATDLERWQQEYMTVVGKGEKVFHGGLGNENTVSCDQCHPNATNTHPETYPKFQQQLGRVAELWEMVNWCIMNPLEAEALAADDPKMIALLTYINHERRGVPLAPGKH